MVQKHGESTLRNFNVYSLLITLIWIRFEFYNALCILMMMFIASLIVNCFPHTEGLNGSWKDGGFTPSSYSSSGYWSWSAPSDQSNPSTPSPPLSADSFKPFRMPSVNGPPDDNIDEHDGNSLLFDEPIPRKRKVSRRHLSFTYGDLIWLNSVKRYDWRNRWRKIMDLQRDGKNAADVPLPVFLARFVILEVLMQFGWGGDTFRRALNICQTKALTMFGYEVCVFVFPLLMWIELNFSACGFEPKMSKVCWILWHLITQKFIFLFSPASGHFCLLSFNKQSRYSSCHLMSNIKSEF